MNRTRLLHLTLMAGLAGLAAEMAAAALVLLVYWWFVVLRPEERAHLAERVRIARRGAAT